MNQHRRALVVIDVQNEFLSPKGNFPCPDESTKPLIRNLSTLMPQFRSSGGQIIWVQAFYEDRTEAPAGMTDHDKGTDDWLTSATHVYHISCCKAGTLGAEIHPDLWAVADVNKDKVVTKGFYSAFQGTAELLDVLRAEGVSDAYFCGIASGTCVLASVLDAVKLKDEFRTHVVVDCLGYRRLNNHEEALERMKQLADLEMVDSKDLD